MRRHSSTDRRSLRGVALPSWLERRRLAWTAILSASVLFPQLTYGQIGKWSLTGSVGYGMLRLDGVDAKNQSDVEGWTAQGIPIDPLPSLKQSPVYTAGVSYRYDREFAFSISGSYWSKTVSSSYTGTDATLQLDRGVGSTDILFGILYYPGNQTSIFEWFVKTDLVLTMARANSRAVGSSLKKVGGAMVLSPFVDTDGIYKKTKAGLGVSAGIDRELFGGFHFTAAAGYRFAQMGTMDGDITSFGVHSAETSTTEFDYSGLLISAGLRFEL